MGPPLLATSSQTRREAESHPGLAQCAVRYLTFLLWQLLLADHGSLRKPAAAGGSSAALLCHPHTSARPESFRFNAVSYN